MNINYSLKRKFHRIKLNKLVFLSITSEMNIFVSNQSVEPEILLTCARFYRLTMHLFCIPAKFINVINLEQ